MMAWREAWHGRGKPVMPVCITNQTEDIFFAMGSFVRWELYTSDEHYIIISIKEGITKMTNLFKC